MQRTETKIFEPQMHKDEHDESGEERAIKNMHVCELVCVKRNQSRDGVGEYCQTTHMPD